MLENARGTVIVWVVAAVLGTLAAIRLLDGGGDAAPPLKLDGAEAGGASGLPSARGGSTRREGVFVHVAGAVRRPGLYRLRSDARVAEALARAGGPRPRAELTAVNLAARVADGQQVVVPVMGRGPAGGAAVPPGAAAAPGAEGAKVSLATATVEQLEELDGIGPTLAERIIEFRDAQGGLTSLDQLNEVEGIGEKRLASLREGLQP